MLTDVGVKHAFTGDAERARPPGMSGTGTSSPDLTNSATDYAARGDQSAVPRRGPGRGDRARRARTRGPQSRHAARGDALGRHAAGATLPADPLRHPVRRPGDMAARGRGTRRATAVPVARGHPGASERHPPGDHGVRRQRTRAAAAAPGQPAVVARGSRHDGVDRHSPVGAAAGGRPACSCE